MPCDLEETDTQVWSVYLGMVNNTSIDWYFPWPEQALYAVASVFISPDVSSQFPIIIENQRLVICSLSHLRDNWFVFNFLNWHRTTNVLQSFNCLE
jgi:hypothetical protein